jgi:hypothetical protein
MVMAKNTAISSHIQLEKPVVLRFLGGLGFGSGVWQRQHTSLSSGFQVLQFGQSMLIPLAR